jgi:hypothetical protein
MTAARSTLEAGKMTSDLSGAFIAGHRGFVGMSSAKLAAAGRTDTRLQGYLATAAELTEDGARRLDAIAAQTRAMAQVTAGVSTPAGEKALLAGLRSQLARAARVVNSTKEQAAGLGAQVRLLKYPNGRGRVHTVGFGTGGAPRPPPPATR